MRRTVLLQCLHDFEQFCKACQAFDGTNRMVEEVVATTGDPASLQGTWH